MCKGPELGTVKMSQVAVILMIGLCLNSHIFGVFSSFSLIGIGGFCSKRNQSWVVPQQCRQQ